MGDDDDDNDLATLQPDHLADDVSPRLYALVALLILAASVAVFVLLESWP